MYKKLLIVVDLSNLATARKVVDTALMITQNTPDAIYRVATVIEPMDDSFISAFLPKNFDKSVVEEANKALHEFTQAHFPKEAKVQHIVAHGTIYEEINHIAEEKDVDLILMLASSRKNAQGISANTTRLLRATTKPVLVLK